MYTNDIYRFDVCPNELDYNRVVSMSLCGFLNNRMNNLSDRMNIRTREFPLQFHCGLTMSNTIADLLCQSSTLSNTLAD